MFPHIRTHRLVIYARHALQVRCRLLVAQAAKNVRPDNTATPRLDTPVQIARWSGSKVLLTSLAVYPVALDSIQTFRLATYVRSVLLGRDLSQTILLVKFVLSTCIPTVPRGLNVRPVQLGSNPHSHWLSALLALMGGSVMLRQDSCVRRALPELRTCPTSRDVNSVGRASIPT